MLKKDDLFKYTRLPHAITYASCQGLTLRACDSLSRFQPTLHAQALVRGKLQSDPLGPLVCADAVEYNAALVRRTSISPHVFSRLSHLQRGGGLSHSGPRRLHLVCLRPGEKCRGFSNCSAARARLAAFAAGGWAVASVDLDPKFQPTICCDIMELDKTALGHFDMAWASPVCAEYSKPLSRRPRNLEAGHRLVLRTLEIIANLRPRWWAFENPQTGLLKTALQRRLLLQIRLPVQEGH